MIGVARARNDENVRTHRAHVLNDLVDEIARVNRDDDAGRGREPAGFEKGGSAASP